jgi:hypothetical protein
VNVAMSAAAQARRLRDVAVKVLAGADLSYAPPFSPIYDPVVVAARVGSQLEQG